ncbi:hypothetical protein Ddc_15947 [Ditylenchus destructor]|nr:hypothetical protein Ddc_15947 [Ditylenchus destructor]
MSKIIPIQSVERPGSPVAGASGSKVKNRTPKPLRSTNRDYRHQNETGDKIIASDSSILPDIQNQWFKDRGITIDMPGDMQLNNVIIGEDLKDFYCVDLCVLGPAQEEKLTEDEKTWPWFSGQQFKAEVLFYAEFSPHRNKYSWASMAFFLKLLYDQSTYVKKLSMFGLGKKLKEILFANEEESYIRCREFILGMTRGAFVKDICESVSWLEKNVQADNIQLPNHIRYNDNQICDVMSKYLLGSSWISARQVIKLGEIYKAERFFGILIKEFLTVAVRSIFPTIVFSALDPLCCDLLNNQLSGGRILKEKLEKSKGHRNNSQSEEIYTISNGANRMRIEFIRQPRYYDLI